MDTSQSEMDLSGSSDLNITVLHSSRDDTTATEQAEDQNSDDESEDDTFFRLENRTYQCKFCPEIFRPLREIRKHTKVQHPSEWKSFRCMHCKQRFLSGLKRDRHVHFHSLNHPFKCTECDQMYRSEMRLEKHFQAFHDRNSYNFSMRRFQCGSCELTFVERKYYDMHSTIYHERKLQRPKYLSDKIQVCERCVKTFDSRDSWKQHIRYAHQKDPPLKNFICKICSKHLKTVSLLRIHILVVHFGIMPFVCQHCNAGFSSRHWVLKHMEKDHSEVALFKCPSCDESFTTELRMTEHTEKVHVQMEIEYNPQTGKPVYPCEKCEKKLESKDLLNKHLVKAHPSFMLMYKCPLCSQSVRYRKQHMRVHHDMEYDAKKHHYLVHYKCHCCSKLFQHRRNLLDHQSSLSQQCGRCQMRFKTKKSLQAHMTIHQANKSLKCEDCGMDFVYRGRLEEHREQYHSPTSTQELKIMNCPYCPKMFINPSNRARHIAAKHVQSEFKINCSHCPVQLTDVVQLRKHYRMEHPKERVTFKCPECEKFYRCLSNFKHHYKKHKKEAGADDKTDMNCSSELIEDGAKESDQTNNQNVEGELESIVIKEEAIVQIGNAAVPGVNEPERSAEPSMAIEHTIGADQRVPIGIGSESNSLNMTVGSKPADHHSMRDNTAVGDPTFFRLDSRTYQCKFCPEIFHLLRKIRYHTKVQHPSEWKSFMGMRRFPRMRDVHFRSLNHPFKCTECDQMYRSKIRLEKHFQDFHDRNSNNFSMERFHCASCELAFVEKKYYDLHSRIYHDRKPQRLKNLSNKIQVCERCVKTFDSRNLLMEHIRQTHQDEPPLKDCICKTCSKDLKKVTLLRTHILVIHFGIMPFVCQHCNADFASRHWLLKHMEKDHSEVALFKCAFCDKSFTTGARMTKHQDKVHVQQEIEYNPQTGKTIYQCRKCEKTLGSKDLLDKHLVKAHPSFKLMYKCPLCSQSVHHRKQHMRLTHDVEYDDKQHQYQVRYKCLCCSKLFQQRRNLLAHQNALSKQCGRCDMRFKTTKSLQTHMAIHRANNSFKCEDCGYDCGYQARLEKHRMRYHSPTSTEVLKIINCSYCPQLFLNPSNRGRHIAVKHVQSIFKVSCGHCPVQMTDMALLRKHYKTVHPEERVTYRCTDCDKFYLNLFSLKSHYKKHRKVAGANNKADTNNPSESIEDGDKVSGNKIDQIEDGDFVSIVVKEEAIVQIGNAAVPGLSETEGIKHNSMNNNEPSEQRVMMEIKQEPLDNGEASTLTGLTEWEKSTAAKETDDMAELYNTSETIGDGVNENNQIANGELVSMVVKEEAIIQIGNAAVPGVCASTGVKDHSLNFIECSEVKIEIKQESLHNC